MYTKEVSLPTLGKIYGADKKIPEKVTLRNFTTQEEKMIFGSSSDNAMDLVIKRCIEEPKNFDINQLIVPDKTALMLHLRMLTLGTDYNVNIKCPECGKKNDFVLDIQKDINYYELDSESEEPILIDLPVSEDKLEVMYIRGYEMDEINKWSKRIEKRASNIDGDISYILRMATMIKKVNGVAFDMKEKAQAYVEKMHGKDSAYFWSMMDELKLGFDLLLYKDCKHCREEMEFVLPMTAEFFRPKFSHNRG